MALRPQIARLFLWNQFPVKVIIAYNLSNVNAAYSFEYSAELWEEFLGGQGQGGLPGLVKATAVQFTQRG